MSENIADTSEVADVDSNEQPADMDTSDATGQQPSPVSTKQKYKFKVDNEDIEEELSNEELASYLSKARGSDKRFREAASLRSEVEQFVRGLKENPKPYLSKLGIDLKSLISDEHITPEMAERILMKQLEEASLSPEQKELRQLKAEKEAREKEQLTKKEKEDAEKADAQRQQAADEVQNEIISVFEQCGMQPTPKLIYQVATTMLQAAEAGKRISPQQALMGARKSAWDDALEMMNSVNDDMLLRSLPKSLLQRINKAMLGNSTEQKPQQEQKKQSKKRVYRTLDELLDD
jgi:hypothetical protein